MMFDRKPKSRYHGKIDDWRWPNTKHIISIIFSTKKISLGPLLQSLERYTALTIDKAANLFKTRTVDEGRAKFYNQLLGCIREIERSEERLKLFEREMETHPYLGV